MPKKKNGFLPRALDFLREEAPFLAGAMTLAAFHLGGDAWLEGLTDSRLAAFLFVWLFVAALWSAFGVVHHADALAKLLGEPFGTLILTLAVVGIEVSLIASVMLSGEAAPTLARDTMMAVLMIVLNGLVGTALLIGGWKHGEQDYNLQGARAFLSVLMPLAVFALMLPALTESTSSPTYAPPQASFVAVTTVMLYGVFLGIQTVRHKGFFQQPETNVAPKLRFLPRRPRSPEDLRPLPYHAFMLIATLLPIVLMSQRIALLVDFGIVSLGAPVALGGVLIALLVLTPESMAAIRAAQANQLQRSVNLLLGSALATIGLTVPAVLIISLVIEHPLTLGLDPAPMALLALTLVISPMTFGGPRTNILQGAVHVVLFLAYVMLIFSP